MKKLFTADDFMVAFISALGYGFGETIARLSGWPDIMCVAACIVLGTALREIVSKIAFSETVQKKTINRVLTFMAIFLIFIAAHYIAVVWMGVSMLDYLLEDVVYTVVLPIISFFVNLFIRVYEVRKIRKLYGDGSEGYVFEVAKEKIDEINQQNQPILGEYNRKYAVKTRTGIYVGEKCKKVINYLGIPYAKPPLGELRWKASEPLPSSEAVFEAKNFGASAIQVEHKGSILKHHRQSEDCLTLNIVVSAKKTEKLKPVIIVFHHGDFTYGGSADPLLDGGEFVSKNPDIVLVSINYRLGIFGFIDFSEIPGGEAYPDTKNLGLLDQIAALKWIKENIAAFGGNPEQITLLGFESGATSICLLAACERAKGLFHRAFAFDVNLENVYETPQGARNLAKNLLKETQTETMQELLQLKTETLKNAAQRLWRNMCVPTRDGELIPVDIYRAYKDGAASGIEFVIGIPSREMQVFRSFIGEENYEELISLALSEMQKYTDTAIAGAIQEYIETQTALSGELEAKSKLVEQWNALCIYRTAVKLSEGGNKVYLMYWDEKPLIENLGSGRVDAVAALFGNSKASQIYGSVMNADISEALQALLYKFVNGKSMQLYPNEIKGVNAFEWKKFPQALIISEGKLKSDTIEDRLTDVKALLSYMLR